jgi:hypothetical protein
MAGMVQGVTGRSVAPRGDQLITKAGVKNVTGFVETAASLLGAEPVAAGAAIVGAAADLLPDDDDDSDGN